MPILPVLQNVAIINSRPSIWGDLAIALARRHPACVSISETISGEGDKMVAKCVVRRRNGSGAEESVERTFSVDDAKGAQLWGKNIWKQYPKRMLQMRARAYAIRDALPDALMGLAMAEEMQDAEVRTVQVAVRSGGDKLDALADAMSHDPTEAEYSGPSLFDEINAAKSPADMARITATIARLKDSGRIDPDTLNQVRKAWKKRNDEITESLTAQHEGEEYVFDMGDEPAPPPEPERD